MSLWKLARIAALAPAVWGQTLHLEEVLESVRRHYPPLLAALTEVEAAAGEALAAEGRFDTTIRFRTDTDSFGYYSNRRADFSADQPLLFQGLTLYGGYRVGGGDFAPYDGKLDTRSLGEVRAGFKLPLLRDRLIDSGRGSLAKARIGTRLAALSVDQQRLVIVQNAIHRYWTWVGEGQRLTVTRKLLGIAETRQKLLDDGVNEGLIAAVEAVDNRRAVLQRQSQVIDAERSFRRAAIDLSLFYRDSAGEPLVAGLERVPTSFPPARLLDPAEVERDEERAAGRRPETARLAAQRDQLEIDRRLAENARKPAVDLVAGFTSEGGAAGNVRRGPQELKAALVFELPFQNRAARGRQASIEANLRQLDLRARYLRETIQAEVRDAAAAVEAARRRVAVLADEVRVSRELEEAERARFELGEGTLFILNLREQATADAAVRQALAEADHQRAMATYDFATGTLLGRAGFP